MPARIKAKEFRNLGLGRATANAHKGKGFATKTNKSKGTARFGGNDGTQKIPLGFKLI